jgi:hypothetical protein
VTEDTRRAPPNKEMQRTKHRPTGASPLISVFDGPLLMMGLRGEAVLGEFGCDLIRGQVE